MDDLWYDENKAGQAEINLSQTINNMKITATKEIIDPTDDNVFQAV